MKKSARATREEVRARIQSAPRPTGDYVTDERILQELAIAYQELTGRVPAVTDGQRRILAASYRLHGRDTIPLMRSLYRGTENNLLLELRTHPPRARAEAASLQAQPPQAAPLRTIEPAPEVASTVTTETIDVVEPVSPMGNIVPLRRELVDKWGYIPGVTYRPDNRPPFDPTSKRVYRRPCRIHSPEFVEWRADGTNFCGACHPHYQSEGAA